MTQRQIKASFDQPIVYNISPQRQRLYRIRLPSVLRLQGPAFYVSYFTKNSTIYPTGQYFGIVLDKYLALRVTKTLQA